jgi:hypothetical protein
VLAGEHAVDGVERHADKEDHRDEEERQGRARPNEEERTGGEREEEGGNGDLVRGRATAGQVACERSQPCLEGRFQVVDAGHLAFHPTRIGSGGPGPGPGAFDPTNLRNDTKIAPRTLAG